MSHHCPRTNVNHLTHSLGWRTLKGNNDFRIANMIFPQLDKIIKSQEHLWICRLYVSNNKCLIFRLSTIFLQCIKTAVLLVQISYWLNTVLLLDFPHKSTHFHASSQNHAFLTSSSLFCSIFKDYIAMKMRSCY